MIVWLSPRHWRFGFDGWLCPVASVSALWTPDGSLYRRWFRVLG